MCQHTNIRMNGPIGKKSTFVKTLYVEILLTVIKKPKFDKNSFT
jgi:hypothetical protein